jgi:hypothetical protein
MSVLDNLRRSASFMLAWTGLIKRPRFLVHHSTRNPPPAELGERDFVVVRSGRHLKWACFRCPCGCGEKISLGLVKDRRPSWSVSIDWLGRPSVRPSVWQWAGCYSHFWIKAGELDWAGDTGHPPQQYSKSAGDN